MVSLKIRPVAQLIGILLLCLPSAIGCATSGSLSPGQPGDSNLPNGPHQPGQANLPDHPPLPREFEKVCLPEYQIEPPDILLIDATRVIPKPPYKISPLDSLLISVPNAFPGEPIAGQYPVDTDGTVNLGDAYGSVRVSGLSLEEARKAIETQLSALIKAPRVVVYVGQARGIQQIRGEHLVSPDGVVRLGVYGSVRVAGMTVPQAKAAIELHLTKFLENPELSVDVGGYNSKVYYIIFDGGGNGQQIIRLPWTGNETVLDALSQSRGLPSVSSTNHLWVARPALPNAECDQILPVDWAGITTSGRSATNYQLLPGDRIYVQAQPLITLDTSLARIFAPIERILGTTLLGSGVYQAIRYPRASANGGT